MSANRHTKVINLFGEPGAGKSTTAAGLFYQLKKQGYSCELALEWIKHKVFDESTYPFKDQLYVFAKQHKLINELNGKVDYIITDSPLLLSLIYAQNSHEPDSFRQVVVDYFNRFSNINFLIKRTHDYQLEGRLHNEAQANEISERVLIELKKYTTFQTISSKTAVDDILLILSRIEGGVYDRR